jgi:hypothetical protein
MRPIFLLIVFFIALLGSLARAELVDIWTIAKGTWRLQTELVEAKDAKQDHDTVVRISAVNITNSDQTYAVISSSFDFFFSVTDSQGLSVERIGGKPAYRSTIHLRDFRVIPPGGAYVVEVNLSRRHNMKPGFYKLVVRKPLDLREGFIGEYDERRTRGTIDAAPLEFEVRP